MKRVALWLIVVVVCATMTTVTDWMLGINWKELGWGISFPHKLAFMVSGYFTFTTGVRIFNPKE